MDTETKAVLTESEKLRGLTEHEGWAVARAKLIYKVLELQSIEGIDINDPAQAVVAIKSRQEASRILTEFLNDIEGIVAQAAENISLLPKKDSFIVRTNR